MFLLKDSPTNVETIPIHEVNRHRIDIVEINGKLFSEAYDT